MQEQNLASLIISIIILVIVIILIIIVCCGYNSNNNYNYKNNFAPNNGGTAQCDTYTKGQACTINQKQGKCNSYSLFDKNKLCCSIGGSCPDVGF